MNSSDKDQGNQKSGQSGQKDSNQAQPAQEPKKSAAGTENADDQKSAPAKNDAEEISQR